MDARTLLRQVVSRGKGTYQTGTHGALLDLRAQPRGLEIILVGDLHARTDNWRAIISHADAQGCSVRQRVADQQAVLVFLGDIVHQDPYFAGHGSPEEMAARLRDMKGSIAIMRDIIQLKAEFPERVYYILGNHDYLSDRFAKGGVHQGIEYRKALEQEFGPAYVADYLAFLRQCPVLLVADGLLAAHGGPARGLKSLDAILLLDPLAEENPLLEALQWGRYGSTYTARDVLRFLKIAGQPGGFFVVGHSPAFIPYGDFKTELCPRHFILYSAGDFFGYAVYRNKELKFFAVEDSGKKVE